MSDSANYPDVLGLITGGARCNIGAAQVAVAVRPRIVRAGRPFEVILLVQNASDGEIDVTMALHLPSHDAKRQRERFIGRTQRMVVSVKGAEVGYVTLPVTTLPDTAVSDAYKIGVEVEVKSLGKANRIRANDGGGTLRLETLREGSKAKIEALKSTSYVTSKPFARSVIDVPLTVMSGVVGAITDFTPGWTSVCKVTDYGDDRLLLHRFGARVQVSTLPNLKRDIIYAPLLEATKSRFAGAGYPLHEAEAAAIARLLTLILEYATPRFNAHGNVAAGVYDIESMLMRDPFKLDPLPTFPHWFRSFIAAQEQDERVASYPEQVIPRYFYDDLLRDGLDFGFSLVDAATGEDLGSAEERVEYREGLIAALGANSDIDFSRVYLPLVMGGILINDLLAIDRENPADLLRSVSSTLEERVSELSDSDEGVYIMAKEIIARMGQRYGLIAGR
jgi:hypothetical protein